MPRRRRTASPPVARPPGKWLKFFIGLSLLPLVVGLLWSLVTIVVIWLPSEGWRSPWATSLGIGFAVWLLIYFALPRPMWIYVLGHELTHALAVYLSGGRIYEFRVTHQGGHVATDTVNWWIALSPYFVPLYTLIWIGCWVVVDFYYPLDLYEEILFFGIGATLSFHTTFTISMLHLEQTDLSGQGYLFSAVTIVGMNTLLVLLFLIPLAHNVTWERSADVLGERIYLSYEGVGWGVLWLWDFLGQLTSSNASG